MIPRRRLHNAMRILAVAGLAVGFAVTAVAADVVILKDGFVLQGTVRKETTSIHDPASGKIRWLVSSIREQPSDALTLVTGSGRIQTQDGNWRKFTFNCSYDNRSGRAKRASAKF